MGLRASCCRCRQQRGPFVNTTVKPPTVAPRNKSLLRESSSGRSVILFEKDMLEVEAPPSSWTAQYAVVQAPQAQLSAHGGQPSEPQVPSRDVAKECQWVVITNERHAFSLQPGSWWVFTRYATINKKRKEVSESSPGSWLRVQVKGGTSSLAPSQLEHALGHTLPAPSLAPQASTSDRMVPGKPAVFESSLALADSAHAPALGSIPSAPHEDSIAAPSPAAPGDLFSSSSFPTHGVSLDPTSESTHHIASRTDSESLQPYVTSAAPAAPNQSSGRWASSSSEPTPVPAIVDGAPDTHLASASGAAAVSASVPPPVRAVVSLPSPVLAPLPNHSIATTTPSGTTRKEPRATLPQPTFAPRNASLFKPGGTTSLFQADLLVITPGSLPDGSPCPSDVSMEYKLTDVHRPDGTPAPDSDWLPARQDLWPGHLEWCFKLPAGAMKVQVRCVKGGVQSAPSAAFAFLMRGA